LDEKANDLAVLLKGKGVQPDTIVGIMTERSVEMIIGLWGIIKAGGAYLPLDPEYPPERIDYMLKDSEAKFLVTNPGLSGKFEKLLIINCQLLIVNEIPPNRRRLNNPPQAANSIYNYPLTINNLQLRRNSLAYVIYTSGTTGKSKGTLTTHRNVIRVVKDTNYIELKSSDRILQLSNYAFDGSVFDIYGALLNGALLVMIKKEDVLNGDRLSHIIAYEQITVFFLTTALFNTIVDVNPECLCRVRKILFGGEQISVSHTRRALEYLGKNRLMHVYGPTETTVYATHYFINTIDEQRETIPIGQPITRTSTYILDRSFCPVPLGVCGELFIGGEGLARGYLNQPELTAEKFDHDLWDYLDYHDKEAPFGQIINAFGEVEAHELHELTPVGTTSNQKFLQGGPGGAVFTKSAPPGRRRQKAYRTGDLTRWLQGGNIEFIGRVDSQVKIRGFRIEPGEIQRYLLEYSSVREAVVIPKSRAGGDKYLCAYIVGNAAHTTGGIDIVELREYLSQRLPAYMIPSYFILLPELPLNPSGKVNTRALPEPDDNAAGTYTAPIDWVEKQLTAIWSDILSIPAEKISRDVNFFEIGGHSLKAAVLMSRIHRYFNVKISLRDIFSCPVVKDLAGFIKGAAADAYRSIEPVEEKEYYPLSSAQQRLFIHQHMIEDNTSYNTTVYTLLQGEVDRAKLERAFWQLITRHENLRTSFHMLKDEPIQRVHRETVISRWSLSTAEVKRNEIDHQIKNFVKPFDLSRAPLLRVGLIHLHTPAPRGRTPGKTKKQESILMVDMHHIVTDGFSMDILIKDFMALYTNPVQELPALKLQYKDFVQWQGKQQGNLQFKEQQEYWMRQFPGKIPELRMPMDFSRDNVKDFSGEITDIKIPRRLDKMLRGLAAETGTTLFHLLTAVCYLVLSKYSGQEDIVLGTAALGRKNLDLHGIIGIFVNLLPLRNRPGKNKSFLEFLAEVKENVIDAYNNQDYPFEELVRELNIQGSTKRNPLFDVVFNFTNLEFSRVELPGLTLTSYQPKIMTSRFDLVFLASDQGGQLEMALTYSNELYKKPTAEKIAGHYTQVLEQVLENKEIKLGEIKISTQFSAASAKIQQEKAQFDF